MGLKYTIPATLPAEIRSRIDSCKLGHDVPHDIYMHHVESLLALVGYQKQLLDICGETIDSIAKVGGEYVKH